MSSSGKLFRVLLSEPPLPARVELSQPFVVAVRVRARNVPKFQLTLTFDNGVFDELSGEPCSPTYSLTEDFEGEVKWILKAKSEVESTYITIEGWAIDMFQKTEFSVSVTQGGESMNRNPLTYDAAGVDTERQDRAMPLLRQWIERSFALRPTSGAVKLPLGYFANVIDIGNGMGLALSTDGVGTKILIAQMLDRYDTIGIDCVAMNVNDVLCVGAEPLALLDYIAVGTPHADLLEKIAHGLYRGAELANVTIPGGEIAQVREMIHGVREGYAFDLVGTCIGQVPLDRILTGNDTREGDVIVGLCSSGIHSNGLTLARRIFFEDLGWSADHYVSELGRTIGEELLEPTRIYVREVLAMINRGLRIKALAHITSTGFLNLSRANADVGYVLDELPDPPPIFKLIQRMGNVSDEEMFLTYNMGIGFCIVTNPQDVPLIQEIASDYGVPSHVVGNVVKDSERRVRIPNRRLCGYDGKFYQE